MARISFREMDLSIQLGLTAMRLPADIVSVCFFCRRASWAFNTAPNNNLTPRSLANTQVPMVVKGPEHDMRTLESDSLSAIRIKGQGLNLRSASCSTPVRHSGVSPST